MGTSDPSRLTRRETLKLGAAAAIGGLMSSTAWAAAEEAKKPSINVYPNYAWLRGFSVVPSWGA